MEGLYTKFGMELDPAEKAKKAAETDKKKATVDSKGRVSVSGTNTKTSAKEDEARPVLSGLTSAAGENPLGVEEEATDEGPFTLSGTEERNKVSDALSAQAAMLNISNKEREELSLTIGDILKPSPN